jgi:hypothetical protein
MKKKEVKKFEKLNIEELEHVNAGAGGSPFVEAVSNLEDNRLRWSNPTPTPTPTPVPVVSKPSC